MAAVLIGVGGLMLWLQQNAPRPTLATVVAAADMQTGHIVEPGDVQIVAWPTDSRPPAAVSGEAIVGRRVASPIRAGEPLTEQRVVGPSLLASGGADRVAVALEPNPLTASGLIRPGDLVNLVGQTDAGPRTLVEGAAVLTLTEDAGTVLAVPSFAAASVVRAAATDSIAMVLRADAA
jgi:Flp pilus assembly protein CpaB